MKIMERHPLLYYVLSISLFLVTCAVDFTVPRLMVEFPLLNWIALVFALGIIITPYGSQKLQPHTSLSDAASHQTLRLTKIKWATRIILLELGAFLLYFSCTQFNAAITLPGLTSPVFTNNLQILLFRFGLFPWALIAIFAVSFGIHAYIQEKDTYLSDISLITSTKHQEIGTIIVKTIGRGVTLGGTAITCVMLTVIFASIITSLHSLKAINGFSVSAMGTAFLMLFLSLRRSKNEMLISINKKSVLLGISMTMLIWTIVMSVIALVLSNFPTSTPQETPVALLALLKKGWPIEWSLFSNIWWSFLIPIIAIFIAKLSYGYSLRSVIAMTLILPITLSACMAAQHFSGWHWHFENTPLWTIQLAAAIGALLFFGTLYHKENSALTMLTYLPRHTHVKHRDETVYHQRWKRMCGILFYFFLPAGIFIVSLLMSIAIIPLIYLILAVYWKLIPLLRSTTPQTYQR